MIPTTTNRTMEAGLGTFFTYASFSKIFECLGSAATSVRGGISTLLGDLWARYYPLVAQVEEGIVMPRSELNFIITVLLAFAAIRSQGQPDFPFRTHPRHVRFSIASLLMFGFACALELILTAAGVPNTSVFAIIARLGKIVFISIFVTSLACLFYF